MNSTLYRTSKIGECLRETLFELLEAGKITEEVAQRVLTQFDKSTYTALDQKVQSKATLKGDLKTYRYLDNVWTFVLEPVTLKLSPGSKQIQKEKEELEGYERAAEEAAAAAIAIKTEPGLPLKKEESS